jgi:hypothetical protein
MIDGTRIRDVELRVLELTGRAGDAFVMHCDTFTPPRRTATTSPG